MKYLIAQDWHSTHGNHAGMVHMCNLLVEHYPNDYRMIVKECLPKRKKRRIPILRSILEKCDDYLYRKRIVDDYICICQGMFSQLEKGDEVFLLEYNMPAASQFELACYIKSNYEGVFIYALSHLTPSYFEREPNVRNRIIKWNNPIDKHLTLGNSLSLYFEKIGIPKDKISTGFHYVDVDYYRKESIPLISEKITVIAMGLLQRNYNSLANIVNHVDNVNWIICRGRNAQVDDLFIDAPNVQLKGYMDEEELRHMMDISDVSLNVLEDTVGSNVITTSMAMGLVIVASDVGSIRDYCNDENSILCSNNDDAFIGALNQLAVDKKRTRDMRMASLNMSLRLQIENVNKWFSSLHCS